MDHSSHVRLRDDELTQDVLEGAAVYGPDDSKVGAVDHMHGFGVDVKVIVDVGGVFGLGAKPVALSLGDLEFMRDQDGTVHATTRLREGELKAMAEHVE